MMEKIGKSGLGQAIFHQRKALESAGVEYTLDPNDTFDILHINTYFLKSFFFVKKCKKNGIPIVYHAHSTMEDFKKSFKFSNSLAPVFKAWLMTNYQNADVIITPTEYSKSILQSYGLTQPIYDISNGIDLSSFKLDPKAKSQIRQKYSFSKSDFVVMGIGLFIERKGILDFLELAKRMPDIKFIWFGYTDFKLIPNNIKLAILNKPKNVTFAGYVPNSEIKKAYQACDVFLMPTYEETEGIPILEACACKTPAIIRDIPVFKNWLHDKIDVYKAKSLWEFAHLIRSMQSGKLPNITENAYKIAQKKDLPIIGEKLKNVYKNVAINDLRPKKFSFMEVFFR